MNKKIAAAFIPHGKAITQCSLKETKRISAVVKLDLLIRSGAILDDFGAIMLQFCATIADSVARIPSAIAVLRETWRAVYQTGGL